MCLPDHSTILASPTRKHILSQLIEEGGVTTIETLSYRISDMNGESSSEGLERAKIQLHHAHLPKMEDYGVIEYDVRSGDVVLTDIENGERENRLKAMVK